MKNEEFKIYGQKIIRGSIKDIKIDIPNLYNSPASIPVKVFRGKKDGPTIFISAAIHGNELNGIEIIRRLRKLSLLKKLRGTLILVPVVNVYGLITLSRYLPDRRDLNRSFPGSLKGSLAARVAKIFFDEIVQKCDFGIDLHTASIHKTNLPQIRVDIANKELLELAKSFAAPVILNAPLREGSLREFSMQKNVPILLYEAGEALRFDDVSINVGLRGIVNVLRKVGALPFVKSNKKRISPIVAKTSSWVRANESGMLRTIKDLGDTVFKGEVIAYIDEPFGDESYKIEANFDGIIIGKSQIPLVQEGDAVFHIAKFSKLGIAEEKMEYFQEDVILDSDFSELQEDK